MLEPVVVDAVVVEAADEDAVVEVGVAALCPGVLVVRLAAFGELLAAFGAASPVAQSEGGDLGLAEEAFGASEVEDPALAAEDGGDDASGAGQAAGFTGG